MSESNRSRYFSSLFGVNHGAPLFAYGWNDTVVSTGSGATGNWVPLYVDVSGGLQTSGPSYISVFTTLTGGQTGIPVGALSWNISVFSGTAFINGAPMFAVSTLDGGAIGANNRLSQAINVGVTGGRVLVQWDI